MSDIKEQTQSIINELKAKGKPVSGRTMCAPTISKVRSTALMTFLLSLACHTLPYTCCLVEEEENDKVAPDLTLEIRRADNRSVGVHTPEQDEHSPAKSTHAPLKPLPQHLHHLSQSSGQAATPKSILVNPVDGTSGTTSPNANGVTSAPNGTPPPGSTIPRNRSFVDILTQKTAAYEAKKREEEATKSATATAHNPSRWVLMPRRGHAALNSGIRAMSQEAEVTLVAWPGDMRRGTLNQPEQEGYGDLTQNELTPDLRTDLENGLAAMGGIGKGPSCRAVWLDCQTSKLFYDGYCKTFLWVSMFRLMSIRKVSHQLLQPLFHYFVSEHCYSSWICH